MRLLRWHVLALGVLSVALWLTSYSWMLGLTPPTQWISRSASPWLVAEVGAVALGTIALVAGRLLAKRSTGRSRRVPIYAAGLGAFALVMVVLGLALPVLLSVMQ